MAVGKNVGRKLEADVLKIVRAGRRRFLGGMVRSVPHDSSGAG